eukprot:PhM_4_TR16740/c0_g1_i1/m.79251
MSNSELSNNTNRNVDNKKPQTKKEEHVDDAGAMLATFSQKVEGKSWEDALLRFADERQAAVRKRCTEGQHLIPSGQPVEQYAEDVRKSLSHLLAYCAMKTRVGTEKNNEEGSEEPPKISEYFRLVDKWLDLPETMKKCADCEGLQYTEQQMRLAIERGCKVLNFMLEDEESSDGKRQHIQKVSNAAPASEAKDLTDHFRNELQVSPDAQWLQAFHKADLNPDYVVTLLLAIFLYTVDVKHCKCENLEACEKQQREDSVKYEAALAEDPDAKKISHLESLPQPLHKGSHGWNSQPWAVVNWCLRVGFHSPESFEVQQRSRRTLEIYQFLVEAWEEALFFLPKRRAVVFRGISIQVASKYSLGFRVVFPAFTSTSLVGKEAQNFMNKNGSGTFFIIHVHTASMVQAMSWFPEEAEALLTTFCTFRVKVKMSRTVLQMLGCKYDVVEMAEEGDIEASSEERIRTIHRFQQHTSFIYEGHLATYVISRVDRLPPPRPSNSGYPIFGRGDGADGITEKWLKDETARHMLILGTAGTGKTSTSLAALSRLATLPPGTVDKPIICTFTPLPKIPNVTSPGGIDTYVRDQMGLRSDSDVEYLLENYIPVLLLDSLDEISTSNGIAVSQLIFQNPFCHRCRCLVSCRPEFLETVGVTTPASALVQELEQCSVYYVLPFEKEDIDDCIDRYVQNEREITKLHKIDYRRGIHELFALLSLDYTTMHTPVTLRMAVRVAHTILLDANKPTTDGITAEGDKSTRAARNVGRQAGGRRGDIKKFNVPDVGRMKRWELYRDFINVYAALLSKDDKQRLHRGLQAIALAMTNRGNWHVTVGEALKAMMSSPEARLDERTARLWLENFTPCRMEDAQKDDSAFEWQHKSVGEYLATEALWETPKFSLKTLNVVFSRPAPMLTQLYADIASSHFFGDFKTYAREIFIPLLECRYRNDEEVRLGMPNAAYSNALTMLLAGQYSLDGICCHNMNFEDILFSSVRLDGADFTRATFSKCVFQLTSFRNVNLTLTQFLSCTFDMKKSISTNVIAAQKGMLGTTEVIIYASDMGTVQIFDITQNKVIVQIPQGHAFSAEGRAEAERARKENEKQTGRRQRVRQTRTIVCGHQTRITHLALMQAGYVVTATEAGVVRILHFDQEDAGANRNIERSRAEITDISETLQYEIFRELYLETVTSGMEFRVTEHHYKTDRFKNPFPMDEYGASHPEHGRDVWEKHFGQQPPDTYVAYLVSALERCPNPKLKKEDVAKPRDVVFYLPDEANQDNLSDAESRDGVSFAALAHTELRVTVRFNRITQNMHEWVVKFLTQNAPLKEPLTKDTFIEYMQWFSGEAGDKFRDEYKKRVLNEMVRLRTERMQREVDSLCILPKKLEELKDDILKAAARDMSTTSRLKTMFPHSNTWREFRDLYGVLRGSGISFASIACGAQDKLFVARRGVNDIFMYDVDQFVKTAKRTSPLSYELVVNPSPLKVLGGHEASVNEIVASLKEVMSCGRDGTIRIWDAETGAPRGLIRYSNPLRRIAFNNMCIVGVCNETKTVAVWGYTERALVKEIPSGCDVHSVSLSTGNNLLIGCTNQSTSLWNATTFEQIASFQSSTSVSAVTNGGTLVWYISNKSEIVSSTLTGFRPTVGHVRCVRVVCDGPDGGFVSSGDDKRVIQFDKNCEILTNTPILSIPSTIMYFGNNCVLVGDNFGFLTVVRMGESDTSRPVMRRQIGSDPIVLVQRLISVDQQSCIIVVCGRTLQLLSEDALHPIEQFNVVTPLVKRFQTATVMSYELVLERVGLRQEVMSVKLELFASSANVMGLTLLRVEGTRQSLMRGDGCGTFDGTKKNILFATALGGRIVSCLAPCDGYVGVGLEDGTVHFAKTGAVDDDGEPVIDIVSSERCGSGAILSLSFCTLGFVYAGMLTGEIAMVHLGWDDEAKKHTPAKSNFVGAMRCAHQRVSVVFSWKHNFVVAAEGPTLRVLRNDGDAMVFQREEFIGHRNRLCHVVSVDDIISGEEPVTIPHRLSLSYDCEMILWAGNEVAKRYSKREVLKCRSTDSQLNKFYQRIAPTIFGQVANIKKDHNDPRFKLERRYKTLRALIVRRDGSFSLANIAIDEMLFPVFTIGNATWDSYGTDGMSTSTHQLPVFKSQEFKGQWHLPVLHVLPQRDQELFNHTGKEGGAFLFNSEDYAISHHEIRIPVSGWLQGRYHVLRSKPLRIDALVLVPRPNAYGIMQRGTVVGMVGNIFEVELLDDSLVHMLGRSLLEIEEEETEISVVPGQAFMQNGQYFLMNPVAIEEEHIVVTPMLPLKRYRTISRLTEVDSIPSVVRLVVDPHASEESVLSEVAQLVAKAKLQEESKSAMIPISASQRRVNLPFEAIFCRYLIFHALKASIQAQRLGLAEKIVDACPHVVKWRDMAGRGPAHFATLCRSEHLRQKIVKSSKLQRLQDQPDANNVRPHRLVRGLADRFLWQIEDLKENDVSALLSYDGDKRENLDWRGGTLLHVACERGDKSLCARVLEARSHEVDAQDDFECTPLLSAAMRGRPEIVRYIVETVPATGAQLTKRRPIHGDCAMEYIVGSRRTTLDTLKVLLGAADKNGSPDEELMEALMSSAWHTGSKEVLLHLATIYPEVAPRGVGRYMDDPDVVSAVTTKAPAEKLLGLVEVFTSHRCYVSLNVISKRGHSIDAESLLFKTMIGAYSTPEEAKTLCGSIKEFDIQITEDSASWFWFCQSTWHVDILLSLSKKVPCNAFAALCGLAFFAPKSMDEATTTALLDTLAQRFNAEKYKWSAETICSVLYFASMPLLNKNTAVQDVVGFSPKLAESGMNTWDMVRLIVNKFGQEWLSVDPNPPVASSNTNDYESDEEQEEEPVEEEPPTAEARWGTPFRDILYHGRRCDVLHHMLFRAYHSIKFDTISSKDEITKMEDILLDVLPLAMRHRLYQVSYDRQEKEQKLRRLQLFIATLYLELTAGLPRLNKTLQNEYGARNKHKQSEYLGDRQMERGYPMSRGKLSLRAGMKYGPPRTYPHELLLDVWNNSLEDKELLLSQAKEMRTRERTPVVLFTPNGEEGPENILSHIIDVGQRTGEGENDDDDDDDFERKVLNCSHRFKVSSSLSSGKVHTIPSVVLRMTTFLLPKLLVDECEQSEASNVGLKLHVELDKRIVPIAMPWRWGRYIIRVGSLIVIARGTDDVSPSPTHLPCELESVMEVEPDGERIKLKELTDRILNVERTQHLPNDGRYTTIRSKAILAYPASCYENRYDFFINPVFPSEELFERDPDDGMEDTSTYNVSVVEDNRLSDLGLVCTLYWLSTGCLRNLRPAAKVHNDSEDEDEDVEPEMFRLKYTIITIPSELVDAHLTKSERAALLIARCPIIAARVVSSDDTFVLKLPCDKVIIYDRTKSGTDAVRAPPADDIDPAVFKMCLGRTADVAALSSRFARFQWQFAKSIAAHKPDMAKEYLKALTTKSLPPTEGYGRRKRIMSRVYLELPLLPLLRFIPTGDTDLIDAIVSRADAIFSDDPGRNNPYNVKVWTTWQARLLIALGLDKNIPAEVRACILRKISPECFPYVTLPRADFEALVAEMGKEEEASLHVRQCALATNLFEYLAHDVVDAVGVLTDVSEEFCNGEEEEEENKNNFTDSVWDVCGRDPGVKCRACLERRNRRRAFLMRNKDSLRGSFEQPNEFPENDGTFNEHHFLFDSIIVPVFYSLVVNRAERRTALIKIVQHVFPHSASVSKNALTLLAERFDIDAWRTFYDHDDIRAALSQPDPGESFFKPLLRNVNISPLRIMTPDQANAYRDVVLNAFVWNTQNSDNFLWKTRVTFVDLYVDAVVHRGFNVFQDDVHREYQRCMLTYACTDERRRILDVPNFKVLPQKFNRDVCTCPKSPDGSDVDEDDDISSEVGAMIELSKEELAEFSTNSFVAHSWIAAATDDGKKRSAPRGFTVAQLDEITQTQPKRCRAKANHEGVAPRDRVVALVQSYFFGNGCTVEVDPALRDADLSDTLSTLPCDSVQIEAEFMITGTKAKIILQKGKSESLPQFNVDDLDIMATWSIDSFPEFAAFTRYIAWMWAEHNFKKEITRWTSTRVKKGAAVSVEYVAPSSSESIRSTQGSLVLHSLCLHRALGSAPALTTWVDMLEIELRRTLLLNPSDKVSIVAVWGSGDDDGLAQCRKLCSEYASKDKTIIAAPLVMNGSVGELGLTVQKTCQAVAEAYGRRFTPSLSDGPMVLGRLCKTRRLLPKWLSVKVDRDVDQWERLRLLDAVDIPLKLTKAAHKRLRNGDSENSIISSVHSAFPRARVTVHFVRSGATRFDFGAGSTAAEMTYYVSLEDIFTGANTWWPTTRSRWLKKLPQPRTTWMDENRERYNEEVLRSVFHRVCLENLRRTPQLQLKPSVQCTVTWQTQLPPYFTPRHMKTLPSLLVAFGEFEAWLRFDCPEGKAHIHVGFLDPDADVELTKQQFCKMRDTGVTLISHETGQEKIGAAVILSSAAFDLHPHWGSVFMSEVVAQSKRRTDVTAHWTYKLYKGLITDADMCT